METQTGRGERTETCDIHTCEGSRRYLVTKGEKTSGVCVRCMEELVTAFGWKLTGGRLAAKPPQQPAVQY